MSIPIPIYIKHYTKIIYNKKNYVSFSLICSCKNESFTLYKNYLSDEQQKEIDDYDK